MMRRGAIGLSAAAFALALGIAAWPRVAASLGHTTQAIHVIDGDTLEIDGTIVDLYGIDAPELGQTCLNDGEAWPCGLDAAFALRKQVTLAAEPITCRAWVADKAASVCRIGAKDVGEVLLSEGYAVAVPGSFPDYGQAQRIAKHAHLGLWRGEFVMPWEWRAGKRFPGEEAHETGPCPVKAVVVDGRRIYYVPTDADYDSMVLDPARGDHAFCSDEEARAAGWRRAGERP